MEPLYVAGACALLLTGFGANEATHGGMAETMGLGHQHMLDHGGYHCTDMTDEEMWALHEQHMHGGPNATQMPYGDHCGADHMGMGSHHGGGMMGGSGGMMGGGA